LSILNISDNRIGNHGLNALIPALTEDCSLVSLSLSNNNLEGITATNIITKYLKANRNIVKLDFSNNAIGDEAMNPLSEALSENTTRIK
jgi:Ran GTPase-activating protein (RanGAP) involved in mRNA processing and transport